MNFCYVPQQRPLVPATLTASLGTRRRRHGVSPSLLHSDPRLRRPCCRRHLSEQPPAFHARCLLLVVLHRLELPESRRGPPPHPCSSAASKSRAPCRSLLTSQEPRLPLPESAGHLPRRSRVLLPVEQRLVMRLLCLCSRGDAADAPRPLALTDSRSTAHTWATSPSPLSAAQLPPPPIWAEPS